MGLAEMDLNTVLEVSHPSTRETLQDWSDGDAWLAGGTWLFSEPQPGIRRLIDLEGLRWEPLKVAEAGLSIAATCRIRQLDSFTLPGEWLATPLIRQCCQSLMASFKIWNTGTVGGNLCMSLPAGALISLTAALEGVCTIWLNRGGERTVNVADFVTGAHENVLGPGDLLRKIDLPENALRKRTSFRRMSLTHLGRSAVLLIGTLCPRENRFALTVTAATVRPVRMEFSEIPDRQELRDRILQYIPNHLYLDDVHGTPDYRKHLTFYFAEEIRRELSAGGVS